jgi:hypothetical protein
MPEDTKKIIDSSEPLIDVGEEEGAEINLDEPNNSEKEVAEEKVEVEQVDAQEAKPVDEKKEEKKDELKEYSEGVQKRIAKLTRKMREAEKTKRRNRR